MKKPIMDGILPKIISPLVSPGCLLSADPDVMDLYNECSYFDPNSDWVRKKWLAAYRNSNI